MHHFRRGFAFALVLFSTAPALFAQTIWHTDLNAARRDAERLNRPLVCHFGAKWCGPCQKMERTVFNQPAVISQLQATAVCLKIDVDDHPELAQRFGVERFPTDVVLEPNGQRLMQATGYQTPDEYRAFLNRAAQRYAALDESRQRPPTTPPSEQVQPAEPPKKFAEKPTGPLLLEGYCPVALHDTRTWKKGNPQFVAAHKGQTYQFVSPEARDKFLSQPEKYVPQFLGCDAVLIFTADRVVSGSIEWGAFYDDHLYLFTSEDNRRNFKASPEKYVRTRVVLKVDQIESAIR